MKKKFLDPQIVIKRTSLMMQRQIIDLSEYFGEFERDGDSYCTYLNSGEMLSVRYYEDSKFMSKIFSTKITLYLEDIRMEKTWQARLSFRGLTAINELLWQPLKREFKEPVSRLNTFYDFNSQLLKLAQQMDLVTIEARYTADTGTLKVDILPYAGSYVWIKLPPAYCDVPLKKFEVKTIYEIVCLFIHMFAQHKPPQQE